MDFEKDLPMTLQQLALKLGNDAMVMRASIDYDVSKIGTDAHITLVVRVDDIYQERRDRYVDAMEVIDGA